MNDDNRENLITFLTIRLYQNEELIARTSKTVQEALLSVANILETMNGRVSELEKRIDELSMDVLGLL